MSIVSEALAVDPQNPPFGTGRSATSTEPAHAAPWADPAIPPPDTSPLAQSERRLAGRRQELNRAEHDELAQSRAYAAAAQRTLAAVNAVADAEREVRGLRSASNL